MTRTVLSRVSHADDVETSDLNGGRGLVAAILTGAGIWVLLAGITLALWT